MDIQSSSIKSRRRMLTIFLLILLFTAVVGLILIRDSAKLGSSADVTSRYSHPLVDERPVQTARVIARLASTPDERRTAEEAVQLADHEVDVAFADALRDAVEHPLPATPETKLFYARQAKASTQVSADQDQVDRIAKQLDHATDAHKKALQNELDLVRAQLELDQDELDDVKQDLARSGADAVARVQHQIDRHNLAHQHGVDATSTETASNDSEADYDSGNVVAQIAAYYALSRKITPLQQARTEARQDAATLSVTHDSAELQATRQTQPPPVQRRSDSKQPAAEAAALAALRRQNSYQRTLADLGKRVQDEQGLADLYGEWIYSLLSHQRVALYGAIRSVLWILLIIPATYFVGKAAEHLLIRLSRNHQQFANFQVLVRFAWQASGVLLILMVIFGVPAQLPEAIFGIVGAGLTVALKDLAGAFIDTRLRGLVSAYAKQANASG